MTSLSPRLVFSALFLGCAGLLGFGYYLQYVEGLNPCNLCIFERVAFASVGLIALIGLLHGSRGWATRLYHGLGAIAAGVGAAIAARHVWIQNLP
ncbi:MAG: disulfide bond formation protein B, partial [Granulosicoccaceae bacterium]